MFVPCLIALGIALGVSDRDIEDIKQRLDRIEKNQREILDKLNKVAAPAPARPARRGPDPDLVYSFPIGKAEVRGPKKAWVTIVGVMDYQ